MLIIIAPISIVDAQDNRWKMVSKSEDQFYRNVVYLDIKSITGDPKYIMGIWTKSISTRKDTSDNLPYIEEAKAYSEIDCANRKTRLLKMFIKFNDGTISYQDTENNNSSSYGLKTFGQWTDVMPETPNEKEFLSICDQARRNTKIGNKQSFHK